MFCDWMNALKVFGLSLDLLGYMHNFMHKLTNSRFSQLHGSLMPKLYKFI